MENQNKTPENVRLNLNQIQKSILEKWYNLNLPELYKECEEGMPRMPFLVFLNLPFVFQQGLLHLFLRKKGFRLIINISTEIEGIKYFWPVLDNEPVRFGNDYDVKASTNFYTALIAGIEAAFIKLEASHE